jgi:uncharacterized RDD family membrane protein YckC
VKAAERLARAQALRGRSAGFVSRVLAVSVDLAIVVVLTFACFVGVALIGYMLGDGTFELPDAGPLRTAISFPVVEFVYLVALWAARGTTLGGGLIGLRVVRSDGSRLRPARAAVRALCCVVLGFVSLLWIPFSRRDAAVHDLVCGTSVVHDWGPALASAGAALGTATPVDA